MSDHYSAEQNVRVLHVVRSMVVGGSENYLLNVLRNYDRTRFHMDVCYSGPAPGYYAREVESLGSSMIGCHFEYTLLPFAHRLSRILRAGKYHAVCDFTDDFAAGSMLAGRFAGVPVRLAFYRSSAVKYKPTLLRRAYARIMRQIVIQNATTILSNSRANLASFYPGVEPDGGRFAVVYNGLDVDRFTPHGTQARQRIRSEFGIPYDAPVLGNVGSFFGFKGQDVSVKVLARIVQSQPNARLMLVGDGPIRPQIERLAKKLGLTSNIVFTGVRSDVPDLLVAMDLFLFPSLFEGFPNALMEAQCVGLPIVATDRPEMREAMPRGNHDCLAPSENVSAFSEVALRLLENGDMARQKGLAGAGFIRDNFPISRSVEAFSRYLAG